MASGTHLVFKVKCKINCPATDCNIIWNWKIPILNFWCVCNFMSTCIHTHKRHIYRTFRHPGQVHWWNFPVKRYLYTYLSTCSFFLSLHQGIYFYTYLPSTPLNVRQSCSAEKLSLLNACLFYRYDKQQWIKYIWAAAGQSSTMTVSWWTMWCECYTV